MSNSFKLTFLILFLASFCHIGEAKNKVTESKTNYAQQVLQPYVDYGQLPGAISVFYNDGVQETCCIGYADMEAKRRIDLDNCFMQCSQTKGFCGVTIAKLVEEGKLLLDDPVSKYLPEFNVMWVESEKNGKVRKLYRAQNIMTVRMLMNHTAGFGFEIHIKRRNVKGGGWSGGAPLRQSAVAAATSPLLYEPGTRVQYSNTGIDVAAAIVEVITGMKWEEYLKKEVLDPLGMKSTCIWPTDKQLKNKIELYEYRENATAVWVEEMGGMQRPYNGSNVFPSAGGGLWTTVNDQLKFYKMLMNLGVGDNGVRILKEETVKNLLAVSTRPKDMEGYSLGLQAPVEDNVNGWFGHGGALGTRCYVNYHKKQLRLWVIQKVKGPEPWKKGMEQAAKKFFTDIVNQSDAYTGRLQ